MLQLLTQTPDSIPFHLNKEVIASVDTLPVNDFLSYQFLPLDSLKVSYNVEAFNHETLFSGLPALVRPFIQQNGSTLFLVFAFLFVITSFIFSNRGRELFTNLGNTFSLGNRNKDLFNEQITTSDFWGNAFFIFQTIVLYSILVFVLTLQHSNLFLQGFENMYLFVQIMGALFFFMLLRCIVYWIFGKVLLDIKTNDILNTYLWVIYISGILSFVPLFLYIYIPEVRIFALIVIFVIFIVGRITVFVKTYSLFVKSHIGILYFFAYLCGVEIMPYFIVYKAISFIV